MTIERRTTPTRIELRVDDNGEEWITGYGAVFYRADTPGTEFQLWDDLVERVSPQAFDRALAEGDDVRGLFNHDVNNLLGRTSSGTMRLGVDETGLRYDIRIDDDDADHDRVMQKIRRGDLTGSSFSFIADKQSFEAQKDGPDIRTIESVTLFDVGPVTFPAYEATTADLRSVGDFSEARESYQLWRAQQAEAATAGRLGALRRLHEIQLDRIRLTRPAAPLG